MVVPLKEQLDVARNKYQEAIEKWSSSLEEVEEMKKKIEQIEEDDRKNETLNVSAIECPKDYIGEIFEIFYPFFLH